MGLLVYVPHNVGRLLAQGRAAQAARQARREAFEGVGRDQAGDAGGQRDVDHLVNLVIRQVRGDLDQEGQTGGHLVPDTR